MRDRESRNRLDSLEYELERVGVIDDIKCADYDARIAIKAAKKVCRDIEHLPTRLKDANVRIDELERKVAALMELLDVKEQQKERVLTKGKKEVQLEKNEIEWLGGGRRIDGQL